MNTMPHDLEIAELKAEIVRLKGLNEQLLAQQNGEHQAFSSWKVQREELVQFLLDEYRKQHPQEEYERWAREELAGWERGEGKWYSFEEMIGDLEPAIEKPPCPPETSSVSCIPKVLNNNSQLL